MAFDGNKRKNAMQYKIQGPENGKPKMIHMFY